MACREKGVVSQMESSGIYDFKILATADFFTL